LLPIALNVELTVLRRLLATVLVSTCTACVGLTQAGTNPQAPRRVEDAATAISLARLAWIAQNPKLAGRIGSEAEWQLHEKASLEDGVWTVWEPLPDNMVGGSVYILIAQKDGRFLRAFMTE
jgi:hypothetical protein